MNYDFSYQLDDVEVMNALKTCGIYKTTGKRAVIETVILLAMGVIFLLSFIMRGQQVFDIAMFSLCVVIALVLNLYPRYDMKKRSKDCDKNIKLRVYPEKMYLYAPTGEALHIELKDAKITRAQKVGIISVMPKAGGLLIISEPKIPAGFRDEVIEILMKKREAE